MVWLGGREGEDGGTEPKGGEGRFDRESRITRYIRFTWHSLVPFSNLSRVSSVSGGSFAFTTHRIRDIYNFKPQMYGLAVPRFQAFVYSALIRSAIFSATAKVGAAV